MLYRSLGRLVTLVFGDAFYPPLNSAFDNHAGYLVTPITKVLLGSPSASSANFISLSSTVSGLTPLTLANTVLDVARSVTAAGAAGANVVLNIVGKDIYGNELTETLTLSGVTTQETAQAFKSITSITPASGTGTAVVVGVGGKLGLPVKLHALSDTFSNWLGDVEFGGGATVVVGSASAGQDKRGTIKFTTALSGIPASIYMVVDASTINKMVGI